MTRKEEERIEARRLRTEGWSVRRIAKHLGVAKSSVSIWVRDLPGPPKAPRVREPGRTLGPRPAPPRPGEPARYCPRCDRTLALDAFNRAGDGYQHWCRDCFRAYFRERGDRHQQQSRAAHRRRRETARRFVLNYLQARRCLDCGEDEVLVLEFDHCRGEKHANVSVLVSEGRPTEVIAEEIRLCEVVCVNCHRRRTAGRAGYFRATGVPPPSWDHRQHRNGAYLIDVLRRLGCVDCGERDPVVLDFDHRRMKRASVARLADGGCSLATLQAEIAKCDVRCANCHRLRTLVSRGVTRAVGHWAVGLTA